MLRWLIKIILAIMLGFSASGVICHKLLPFWAVVLCGIVSFVTFFFLFRICDHEQQERGRA